jgi:hypothetical protein
MSTGAEYIADEIVRLRRRYLALLREVEHAVELPAQWTLSREMLRWHVPIESVEEPDIDLEILSRVLILRACREEPPDSIVQALLPVPPDFDIRTLTVRCESSYVEVCFRRTRRRGRVE